MLSRRSWKIGVGREKNVSVASIPLKRLISKPCARAGGARMWELCISWQFFFCKPKTLILYWKNKMGLEEITYRGSAGKKEVLRNQRPRCSGDYLYIPFFPFPYFFYSFLSYCLLTETDLISTVAPSRAPWSRWTSRTMERNGLLSGLSDRVPVGTCGYRAITRHLSQLGNKCLILFYGNLRFYFETEKERKW